LAGPTSISVENVTLPEAIAYVGGLFAAFHAVATKLQTVAGQEALNEIEQAVIADLQNVESRGFPGHPNSQRNEAISMVHQAFRATRNAFDAGKSPG
jgi:hypothetical protein